MGGFGNLVDHCTCLLFTRYCTPIHRSAFLLLKNAHTCADIISDVDPGALNSNIMISQITSPIRFSRLKCSIYIYIY